MCGGTASQAEDLEYYYIEHVGIIIIVESYIGYMCVCEYNIIHLWCPKQRNPRTNTCLYSTQIFTYIHDIIFILYCSISSKRRIHVPIIPTREL